jgi:hypothetical protein
MELIVVLFVRNTLFRLGTARGGSRASRGGGRGGKAVGLSEIEALVEDDDDNMNLASMVPGGGRSNHASSASAAVAPSPPQEDMTMGLGLGDFGSNMQLDSDPFSSFSNIGSISGMSNDPLNNNAPDPFIANIELSGSPDPMGGGSGTPDMHAGLIPEPDSAPAPTGKQTKNKGGRKAKPKEPALLASSSGAPSMSAGRPIVPLTLANFAFHAPPTPMFHHLPLLVPNAGTTAHLSSLSKAVSSMSSEELVQLAKELAGMGRDARARAVRTEAELRKIGGPVHPLAPMPDFAEMDESTLHADLAQLHSQALEFDPPGWALESAPPAGGKRKRPDGTFEDYSAFSSASSAAGPASKKKKLVTGGGKNGSGSAMVASSSYESDGEGGEAGGGDDDAEDGYGSDFETGGGGGGGGGTGHAKGKKKRGGQMTEKEKQRQITTFWNDVDEHFAFPTQQTLPIIRPRGPGEFYESYALVSPAQSKQHTIADPSFRIPLAGENWKDIIERGREEERERIQKEKDQREQQAQQQAYQQEQQHHQYMQIDQDDAFMPGGMNLQNPMGMTGSKKKSSSKNTLNIPGAVAGATTTSTGSKKKPSSSTSASAARARSLTLALGYMGLDDPRVRKVLLDTDKALGGDKTFHEPNKQSLSMRLASMILECPEGSQKVSTWSSGPATTTSSSSSKKKDASRDSPAGPGANGHGPTGGGGGPTTPSGGGTQTPTGSSGGAALQNPPAVTATKAKKTQEYSLEKRIEMELKYLGIFSGNYSASSSEYSVSLHMGVFCNCFPRYSFC